jgi:predicted phage tail protein
MTAAASDYTEVILAGELGKKFGRVWNLVVNSPIHAMRLIGLNCPEFKSYLEKHAKEGVHYHVIVDKRHRSTEELQLPAGKRLIIAPEVSGSSGKIFGAIELVAAIAITVVTWGSTGPWVAAAYATAASLAISGVMNLLTTVPKVGAGQASSTLQSAFFNGPTNTQQQGTPVPLVYGQMLVGSQVVSAAIAAVDASSAGVVSGLIPE